MITFIHLHQLIGLTVIWEQQIILL